MEHQRPRVMERQRPRVIEYQRPRVIEYQRPRVIERQRPRVSGSGQRTSAATGHVEFHRNKYIIITGINCNFKLAVQDVALAYYALLSATGHVQLHCNEYIILMGIHCNFKCAVQDILSRCQILELAEPSRIMLSRLYSWRSYVEVLHFVANRHNAPRKCGDEQNKGKNT